MVHIGNDWDDALSQQFTKEYYLCLREFLKKEYFSKTIYPPMQEIFNAFKLTPLSSVKAVILGQDPYHGVGQAHGLCFSVKAPVPPPPSLVNIYKELHADLGLPIYTSGDLTNWAKEGVLLLNTSLTVQASLANSHKGKGWEIFTDEVIKIVNEKTDPVVFFLWGNNARSKKKLIDSSRHLIIESAHPSPLSAYNGFFGSKPFSRANAFLANTNRQIDWRVER